MTLNIKKGIGDFITVAALLFMVVVVMFAVWRVFTEFDALPSVHTNSEVNEIIDNGRSFINTFNIMFPLLMFSLNLYSIIALFFLDSHPLLFVVHLIMLPVTILISAALSNAYEVMISTSAFALAYPSIDYIMLNLPKIMFGFDILGGIALFTVLRNRY